MTEQQIFEEHQKASGVLLALKTISQLNYLENGEIVIKALEHYIGSLEEELKIASFNKEAV